MKKFSSVISANTDLVAKAEMIEYELIQKATTEVTFFYLDITSTKICFSQFDLLITLLD